MQVLTADRWIWPWGHYQTALRLFRDIITKIAARCRSRGIGKFNEVTLHHVTLRTYRDIWHFRARFD